MDSAMRCSFKARTHRDRRSGLSYNISQAAGLRIFKTDSEAVDRLKDLIREHGKWIEPAEAVTVRV
jgi:hypothetical protein